MLADILPYMRCPACSSTTLDGNAGGLVCAGCGASYPFRERILDMMGECSDGVITPFQRLMQAPAIVSIYEKQWRRIGYYIASSRSFDEEVRTVLAFANGKSGGRILDVACGTGIFTRPLAHQSGELVIGFDLSRPMLKHARRLADREGIRNILFIRGTVFQLPFQEAAFPYVNCCGALHLFDSPDAALKEIERILRPGGLLCVQTTIRPSRSAGMAYILERLIRFGFFGESELQKLLNLHGFSLVESERHRISYTFLARRRNR